jgi:hypothetical protein
MFADTCMVCGNEIETNIWGEPVDDCNCLEHKFKSSFVHRNLDVSENSEEYLNETDDEERLNTIDPTMDDTDLEDYVIKKAGNSNA